MLPDAGIGRRTTIHAHRGRRRPRLGVAVPQRQHAGRHSPQTIGNRFTALGYLAAWRSERGIGRPSEVTKPMLDG
jgi:hypothetical protein